MLDVLQIVIVEILDLFEDQVKVMEGYQFELLFDDDIVEYFDDGIIGKVVLNCLEVFYIVFKYIVMDFDEWQYLKCFIVLVVEIVYECYLVEIFWGCICGCWFCQVGMIICLV